MEEGLVVLFQFVFEFFFDALSYWPFDLPSKRRTEPERDVIWPICFAWWFGGSVLGGLSLFVHHYTLIHLAWLRIANLVISPIASGLISQTFAERRSHENPMLIPRNHFWFGFWFSFGVASARFAYALRA